MSVQVNKMKMNILAKKNWVFLQTPDQFEEFVNQLEQAWESNTCSENDAFTEWVNHFYANLLNDLGPSNGHLFS